MARGSGGPQALVIIETILSHIADNLGLPRDQVQELNLLKDGDHLAAHKDIVDNCSIKRCWDTLKTDCDYEMKKKTVETYNRCIKWSLKYCYV